jgi:hypothetical protein
MTHLHTFTLRHPTSSPCIQCIGVTVSLSFKTTQVTPGSDQIPLFPHGADQIFEPGFLPIWWVAPHWVLLCVWGPNPDLLVEWVPLSDQKICCSPGDLGDAPWQQGRWKTTFSEIPEETPEMLRDSWTQTWDTEAFLQQATFYCTVTDSEDLCPKAEPCKQITKARSKV